jgi:hypothetical protein
MSNPCHDAYQKWMFESATEDEEFFAGKYGMFNEEGDYGLAMGFIGGWNARAESRWTPVTERLPDSHGEQVLVHGPHDTELAVYNKLDECWDHADGDDYWHDLTGWFTHWQYLPSPPK